MRVRAKELRQARKRKVEAYKVRLKAEAAGKSARVAARKKGGE